MRIGVDLEDNRRFTRLLRKPSFTRRIFTPMEWDYILSKGARAPVAACGIFCIKEAFGKALGSGIYSLSFQSISVVHSDSGAPALALSGRYASMVAQVSLSHSHEQTIAFCIIE